MKKLILSIFAISLLFIGDIALAQVEIHGNDYNYEEPGIDFPLRDRIKAIKNIQKLRKGALLVRLKTRQSTINAFQKRGYKKLAQEVENKQMEKNKKLMNAFTENFNFCEVYFFYSEDSEKVMGQEWEGIFLNDKLEKDASIVLEKDFVLTVEMGPLVAEPSVVDAEGISSHPNTMSYEGTLVIKDNNFEQLKRPFPFYVKAGQKFLEKKVAKLNRRLHNFHN